MEVGKKMEKRVKRALRAAFVLYVLLMLWLLFGQRLGTGGGRGYWEQLRDNVNLIPFFTIGQFIRTANFTSSPYLLRHAFINLAGNVVMFVPLGFFLPCFWRGLRPFWRGLLACAGCIAIVELVQLFTLLGSLDVDDLILNLAGAAVGHGLYRLADWLVRRRRREET